MINDAWPLFTKGWIGLLALFFLFACVPQDEIVAKPTEKISSAVVQELSENEPIKPNVQSTGAVSLDEPRPKIDPKLVEELKELKKQKKHKRVKVLIEVKDEKTLERLQDIIDESGGKITENFSIGDVVVAEIYSDKIEEVAQAAGVEQVAAERDYIALVEDRITAFSIDKVWESNITGKGVRIAILDTGVGPHNSITVEKGKSFVSAEDENDQNGHGTHVAGIAQKVAKDAVIYNAKVLSKTGGGTTSQILAGINWAVNPDGDDSTDDSVDIISMSFGGMFTELDGPLASAVKEAIQNGVIFVAASGNCKQGCGGFYGVTTPGNVKEVIAVGAVDDNNNIASFSSGDTFDGYVKPDIVAPGVDINSAWLDNGEKTLSGTSMSTPFVSGVIALMLEKESLTQEEAKKKLVETAKDLGDEGWDTRYGAGVVDAGKIFSFESELKPEENIQKVPSINDPNDQSEVLILQNIGDIEYTELKEPPSSPGKFTKVARYQGNEYFVRAGVIEFEDAADLQKFLLEYVPYEQSESVNENTVHRGAREPVLFWTHGLRYYWLLFERPEFLTTDHPFVQKYVQTYIPDGEFTLAQESSHLQATETEILSILNADSNVDVFGISNKGCTDACDAQSYKTDLSSGKCHLLANYKAKGTTYNDEECTTRTDSCNSNAQLNEYYLSCDTGGTQWCSCQGFFCMKDETKSTAKNCQDYGSSWVCSNGACIQGSSCSYSPTCTNTIMRTCKSATTYDRSDATTACNGGCTSYTYYGTYSCPSGQYCQGTAYNSNYPCYTCSTACDGSCKASACYNIDPDCTSSGGLQQCNYVKHSYKQCYSGNVYWYDTSSVRNDLALACNSDQKCVNYGSTDAKCDPKTCSDYGYSQGSCSTQGSKSRIGNSAYECKKASSTTQTLCWSSLTTLGNSDFCSVLSSFSATCNYGEYDCDSDSECFNNGKCLGPFGDFSSSYYDGCCNSGDTWDAINKVCKSTTCTDNDNDGYGNPGSSACSKGSTQDCDDTKSAVNPGASEICGNSIDDNCNQQTDEGCTIAPKADGSSCTSNSQCQSNYCYNNVCRQPCVDNDNDGYGTSGYGCSKGLGDCDDNNNKRYPGNTEVCDSYDNDCDGSTNEGNVCCGNTVCDNGETSSTCLKDCLTQKTCYGDNDCGSIGTCKFDLLFLGKCTPISCATTCTKGTYTCQGSAIYKCEDVNGDGCNENAFVTYCGGSSICVNGKSTCETTYASTKLTLEESGGTITAQKGDIITVNLKYSKDENVQLEYDSTFSLDTNSCSATFKITSDKNCTFTVKDVQAGKTYYIGLKNGPRVSIKTIDPKIIIVTNKKKLHQRFGDTGAVNDLLKETYGYALKNGGILYDLEDYISGHPWSDFSAYSEEYDDQDMKDNSYSLSAAQLVKEKCGSCKHVMILGDDFVVPHFRRDINLGTWFGLSRKTEETYTDIAYAQHGSLTFDKFDELFKIDGRYQGKKVLLLLSDSLSTAEQTAIDNLKQVLKDEGYNPSFETKNSSRIVCNDPDLFSDFNGRTLFIIGTENNNKAFNCLPFVSGSELRNTFFMEVNPWDGRNNAVVINTEDSKVIDFFAELIEDEGYHELRSYGAYVFKVSAKTTGYVALGASVVAVSFGTFGTVPAVLATIGFVADGIADTVDVTNSCVVNYEGFGSCGTSFGFALIPWIPSKLVKDAIKKFGDDDLFSHLEKIKDLIETQFTRLNKYFKVSNIRDAQRVKEDAEYIAKSAEIVAKESKKSADDAIREYRDLFGNTDEAEQYAIRNLIVSGGQMANDFASKGWKRLTLYKGQKLYRGISIDDVPDPKKLAERSEVKQIFADGLVPKKYVPENDNVEDFVTGEYSYEQLGAKGAEKEAKGSRFVALSKSRTISLDYARSVNHDLQGSKYGIIVHANPRSLDYIDAYKTLISKGDANQVSVEFAKNELEILKPDFVRNQDIIGIEFTDPKGNTMGFVNNPGYIK